jgi:hypothetical protein
MANKPRSRSAGFDGTNPFCKTTYICEYCGKRTRETGHSESGVGLCAKCFEEAGLENEHSDYGHETYNPKCPTCRAMKAEGHIFADEKPKKSHKKVPRKCIYNENGKCLQMCGKPCDKSARNEKKCLAYAEENTFAKKLTPTKFCPHCHTDKPVTDFWKMKASKDGYQNWCKSCQLKG